MAHKPFQIWNEDCVRGAPDRLADGSVHLGVFDPPFGIGEREFDKHYKRDKSGILNGYVEAPSDMPYREWTVQWLGEARRALAAEGGMYVVSGYSKLEDVLYAISHLRLHLINHIVWKFRFGVYTTRKFTTSHYHILYLKKDSSVRHIFNPDCRFTGQDRGIDGESLQATDMEDVWAINKTYKPSPDHKVNEGSGQRKNRNKLPEELVRKMILYSSRPNDLVCDFFMGNFTTAVVALKLGRRVCGFEQNPNSFEWHMKQLDKIRFGCEQPKGAPRSVSAPSNRGKPLPRQERAAIVGAFRSVYGKPYPDGLVDLLVGQYRQRLKQARGVTKRDAIVFAGQQCGRGPFSVINVLEDDLLK